MIPIDRILSVNTLFYLGKRLHLWSNCCRQHTIRSTIKPDEIICLKHSIRQFLNPVNSNHQGKASGFMQRLPDISPFQWVCCLITAMSKNTCSSIASLHRQFNGMKLAPDDVVTYKPLHNQLRKPEFVDFMKALTQQAVARFLSERVALIPLKLQRFTQIVLHDGTSFAVHKGLLNTFLPFSSAHTCRSGVSSELIAGWQAAPGNDNQRRYLPGTALFAWTRNTQRKGVNGWCGLSEPGIFFFVFGLPWYFLIRGKKGLKADEIMLLYRSRWQPAMFTGHPQPAQDITDTPGTTAWPFSCLSKGEVFFFTNGQNMLAEF